MALLDRTSRSLILLYPFLFLPSFLFLVSLFPSWRYCGVGWEISKLRVSRVPESGTRPNTARNNFRGSRESMLYAIMLAPSPISPLESRIQLLFTTGIEDDWTNRLLHFFNFYPLPYRLIQLCINSKLISRYEFISISLLFLAICVIPRWRS